MDWVYPISGFSVGLIVGLTGIGGGSLMTPLLVLVFGVAPATAVGTDLLYAALTKSGGAVAHARRTNVRWKVVALLAAGSVPASALTIAALHALGVDSRLFGSVVTSALGGALILTAITLLLKSRLQQWARRHLPAVAPTTPSMVSTIVTGAVLGCLVTVSSVGAGALGTAALLFLAPGLAAREVVGTDIAHAVPLTLVAGLGHAAIGTVNYALLASLLLGSLPGIWLGTQLSGRLPERHLRSALAAMLLLVGGKLCLV